jgi:cell division protease FtsH
LKQSTRTVALWMLIFFGIVALWWQLENGKQASKAVPVPKDYAALTEKVAQHPDEIASITISGDKIIVTPKGDNAEPYQVTGPQDEKIATDFFLSKGITPSYRAPKDGQFVTTLLTTYVPFFILFGMIYLFMRQLQAGGGKAMSFGKSRAKLLTEHAGKITFEDVAGIDEAKDELEEIIHFLKDPKKFTKLGGRIPKGVLLMGAPGTGKTLLARAIAGEAGVPFFSISGSDFVEMFVGVGASRVRDLFEQGKKNAPCIVFIDEIDAVGRHRGAGLGGGHDEREQTLNQLLVEMDGFESNEGVILVAATNRPDVLDPALLRPGRFDRRVVVARPDVKGREGILRVHSKRTPLGPDVDLVKIARGTPGFSGADIESLVNEAALLAARMDKKYLTMSDFEAAKDKVLMGAERRSMIITDEEKKNTAFHEAGHTLVAILTPGADPVHKVTIIPRGMALGLTQQLPVDEKHTYNAQHIVNNITILMGGRAAEEIVLGFTTTGAGNDIERATDLARKMVCEWGMSEKMGPLTYGRKEEQPFLGRDFGEVRNYSEATQIAIDGEIKQLCDDAYARAKGLLLDQRAALDNLAAALLENETLDGEEISLAVKGGKVAKRVRSGGGTAPAPTSQGNPGAAPVPTAAGG